MTAQEVEPTSELILHWGDQFKVGIPRIDEQHQRLFRLCAFIASAVTQKRNSEIVHALLLELAAFADEHFADEERLMEELDYPEIESHRREHQVFRDRINALLNEGGDDLTIGIHVLQVTQSWLKTHLLERDHGYAEHFRNAQSSRKKLSEGLLP
jgi:hemerythrin